MMKRASILMVILFCLLTVVVVAQPNRSETPDARMMRFPDVSADRIVFVYAGDLWTAPKEGGLDED